MSNCPICEYESTDELIIDLRICNACNHIFKEVPVEYKIIGGHELHRFINPITQIQQRTDLMSIGETVSFVFPSMMFFGLELSPSQFYRTQYNHYFNQMSLVTLFERCGLTIKEQHNIWKGTICETTVVAEKVY
jgi:hypothetical protein